MLDLQILQALADSGCTAQQIVDAIKQEASKEALLSCRAKNRERQRRFRERRNGRNVSNVTVTLHAEKDEQNQQSRNGHVTLRPNSPKNEGIYVEEMDVKTMYVKEKEVKEEATNVEITEVPLKQVTVEQVPVSRARARKKSGTEIPSIWPTPEVIQIGLGFGLSLEETESELAAMQDWALSKDQRRVNWVAFARNWFRTAKKKQQLSAKPKIQQISPRLQVILNNRRLFDEAARAAEAERNIDNCFEDPELRPLGGSTPKVIPPNRNSRYG